MPFHPLRPSIIASTALAIVASAQPVAFAASSSLGLAHFDARRGAVVIPYGGAFPSFSSGSVSGPARVFFDFNASAGFTGVHASGLRGPAGLVRWSQASRGAGRVRVTLTFGRATQVVAINDGARKEILLVPQAPGSATPAPSIARPAAEASPALQASEAPTPKPAGTTPAGAPTGDTSTQQTRTFRQTFGQTDFKYTVGPRPRSARRDQVNVGVQSSGVTDFHVMSDPEKNVVAFSISIHGKPARPAAKPKPKPKAKLKGKLVAKPKPKPKPKAKPKPKPTPGPVATPSPLALPSPAILPTPEPLPTPQSELPTPVPASATVPVVIALPTPSPTPTPNPEPGTILSLRGAFPVNTSESTTALASQVAAAGSSVEGVDLEQHFGPLALLLGFEHAGFKVNDTSTTTDASGNATVGHQRDEYDGSIGLGFHFTPWGTDELIGLGYMGRYLSASTYKAATGEALSPPASPSSILTAPTTLFHGPTIFARFDIPVFGPLGLDVNGGVAPYMFGGMSDAGDKLSGLLGYWAYPELYLRFGVLQLGAGYSLTSYQVNDYSYSRSGPQVRLNLRF